MRTSALDREALPWAKYVVIYRVHEPNILILRVVHGHRDLATWFSD